MGSSRLGAANWGACVNIQDLLEEGQSDEGEPGFGLCSSVPDAGPWAGSGEHSCQCWSSCRNWIFVSLHVFDIGPMHSFFDGYKQAFDSGWGQGHVSSLVVRGSPA